MKKAQAWGFDLVIAIIIFIGGILFFYFYTINYPSWGGGNLGELQYEGESISDTLVSEGSPVNWNKNNVVRIGLLSDGKINETKLGFFYELARDDYNLTKVLFKVKNDYYLYFQEEMVIEGADVEGIGKKEAGAENLVKITRVVVYENSIKTMNLYTWN